MQAWLAAHSTYFYKLFFDEKSNEESKGHKEFHLRDARLGDVYLMLQVFLLVT